MIISASRRTDIPAFYARWFINRVRAGWCEVPNPFNRDQVSTISLAPEDVDVIVFWTRNPHPLFPYLQELDARGFRYYFQFTLLDYPPLIDRHNPPLRSSLDTFRTLADRIGPGRLIWRYDPIVLSEITSAEYHQETYARLAASLHGCTQRTVISFMDLYAKTRRRLEAIAAQGARLLPVTGKSETGGQDLTAAMSALVSGLVETAHSHEMEIVSCAEELDLQPYGVRPGKCIDDELVGRLFDLDVSHVKDPGQRKACGCVQSKDIGMYDSCLFGCSYCYATSSFERSRENFLRHDPDSPTLFTPDH